MYVSLTRISSPLPSEHTPQPVWQGEKWTGKNTFGGDKTLANFSSFFYLLPLHPPSVFSFLSFPLQLWGFWMKAFCLFALTVRRAEFLNLGFFWTGNCPTPPLPPTLLFFFFLLMRNTSRDFPAFQASQQGPTWEVGVLAWLWCSHQPPGLASPAFAGEWPRVGATDGHSSCVTLRRKRPVWGNSEEAEKRKGSHSLKLSSRDSGFPAGPILPAVEQESETVLGLSPTRFSAPERFCLPSIGKSRTREPHTCPGAGGDWRVSMLPPSSCRLATVAAGPEQISVSLIRLEPHLGHLLAMWPWACYLKPLVSEPPFCYS